MRHCSRDGVRLGREPLVLFGGERELLVLKVVDGKAAQTKPASVTGSNTPTRGVKSPCRSLLYAYTQKTAIVRVAWTTEPSA